MIHGEIKNTIVKSYQKHANDTGSIEVQIALLTHRINDLNKHFAEHKKDKNTRRGLIVLVGRRRRYLSYLKENDAESYKRIIEQLGLRG